jgi:predicted TIM-barrel fold metal-dependent hydrolase
MQNIHSHTWDASLHFQPDTIREADISRGYPLDLTVRLDTFLEDMAAFEKVVVFGLKARRTGYWVPDEYVADFVAQAPDKLIGFACCDPTQPEHFDDLKYAIEHLNMRGVKMGPIYAGFDPRDEICAPVYRYCQEKGLPILFHTGTTYNRNAPLGFSRPWLWDDLAISYPDLRMILAHVGHPFSDECLVVIRKHPHIYADVSALYYRPWQFYNTLITAQEYKVTHKLLFGTDYPFAKGAESIQGLRNVNQIIGTSTLPRVSEQVIEEILARDALKLIGVIP